MYMDETLRTTKTYTGTMIQRRYKFFGYNVEEVNDTRAQCVCICPADMNCAKCENGEPKETEETRYLYIFADGKLGFGYQIDLYLIEY